MDRARSAVGDRKNAVARRTPRHSERDRRQHPVGRVVEAGGVLDGIVSVYVQGTTAAVMIQENWDESVQTVVVNFLRRLIPKGVWLHDRQDGNGVSYARYSAITENEELMSMKATAELQVVPIGAGTSVREEVRRVTEMLQGHDFIVETHASGTNIEGDLERILAVVGRIHQTLHREGAVRLLSYLKLETRTDKTPTLAGKRL